MIGKLTGVIDSVGEDWLILDVHGVGYALSCSGQTLASIGRPGSPAALHTEMRIRDEVPHLYGFADRGEQEWFRLLTTVQGVGARVALSILSVMTPTSLSQAIASGDKAALSRADGVGPKLAVRLVTELKDKAQTLSLRVVVDRSGPSGAAPQPASPNAEAVSALVNLGYGRGDAFAAVAAVSGGGEKPLADLIRMALRELSAGAGETVR